MASIEPVTRSGSRLPAVLVLCGLALLAGWTLREVLSPDNDRLPGRDSGNIYVWETFTRQVLATGRLPYWNPYHFSGTPHLADPQTTVLYPPALLLRWMPPLLFLGWMMALHVWLGGAGMLFLARVVGLSWPAAAAAATAAALGGSVGAWLYNGHLLLIYCGAWLPVTLAFAVLSVRRGGVLPRPALAVALTLQFLTGYLQGSLYTAGAVALYYLFSAAWPEAASAARPRDRVRPLAQLAVLTVLVLGLTAFQLFPTLVLIADAGRTAGLSYSAAAEGGWRAGDLATMFFPFRGVDETPPQRDLGDRVAYVGFALICLVPFAFTASTLRRTAVFFAILAGGAIGFAMADVLPLYRLHHLAFPGLRVPGRVLFLATFSFALLGAIGLDAFVTLARIRAWRRVAAGALVSGAAAAVALAAAWPQLQGGLVPLMHGWPWLPAAAVAALLACAALCAVGAKAPAMAVLVFVIAADITAFTAGTLHTVPMESAETLRSWMGPPSAGRAVSVCGDRLGAGGLMLNGQAGIDGLAGLHLRSYGEWAFMVKAGEPPSEDGVFHHFGMDGSFPVRRDLLDSANVTAIFSCEPLELPDLTLVARRHGLYAYRNDAAWTRARWVCGAAELPRAAAAARLLNGRYDRAGRLSQRFYGNVRWSSRVSEEERLALESRYRLRDGVLEDIDTWRYLLDDASPANLLALVQSPAVEDTHGFDRGTGAVAGMSGTAADAEEATELLAGTVDCAQDAAEVSVLVMDRPDGRVNVRVNAPRPGYLFLSEPYYAERVAMVDGRPVGTRRANLAFTAVPVPAGRHSVELRYEPSGLIQGLAVSAFTVAAWGFAVYRRRRRTVPVAGRQPLAVHAS
jgi:hypothetical protein